MAVLDFPKAEKRQLSYTWFRDIEPSLDVDDFVQGLLIENSSAVVYGESNAGKTFWVLDLALHVATKMPYFGLRVERGGVIYCALEGSKRFRNRVVGWKTRNPVPDDIPFAVVESSLNLLDPKGDTDPLIQLIEDAMKQIDVPVKLVVIDTLARAMAGGKENAPEDMGQLVINMDRVREKTGACVMFVHHSGKDAARGARGHSSLKAAIDTEIEVVDQGGLKIATAEKQRDLDKGTPFQFRLELVELGHNRYGEPVTTLVVAPEEGQATPAAGRTKLSGDKAIGANMLRLALDRYGKPLPANSHYPQGALAVTEKAWRDVFYQGLPGEKDDTKRKKFNRAKAGLLASEVIRSMDDFVWFVKRTDE